MEKREREKVACILDIICFLGIIFTRVKKVNIRFEQNKNVH